MPICHCVDETTTLFSDASVVRTDFTPQATMDADKVSTSSFPLHVSFRRENYDDYPDNEFSSSYGTTRSQSDVAEEVAAKETRDVARTRTAVVIFLIVSALVIATTAFKYVSNDEQHDFEVEVRRAFHIPQIDRCKAPNC